MNRLILYATDRELLGKKVKKLRREGLIPAHVFGNKLETEHISVKFVDFSKVFESAGESTLVDLKTDDRVNPVLIRGVQFDPVKGKPIHIDFYKVNLKEKVIVPVPIEIIGEEPEAVHIGEAVVLQTLSEVQIEALPTDLIEKIEVNIETLKNIDDAILVSQLDIDRDKLTILAEADEIVVKLAPAVTEEMKALLEEQAAEVTAAQEATKEEEVEGEVKEGEGVEGEAGVENKPEGEDKKTTDQVENAEKPEKE